MCLIFVDPVDNFGRSDYTMMISIICGLLEKKILNGDCGFDSLTYDGGNPDYFTLYTCQLRRVGFMM